MRPRRAEPRGDRSRLRTRSKSPQAARVVNTARENSPCFRQAQSRRPFPNHDSQFKKWGLDDEVIGERGRIELGPQQARASFEISRHHGRGNLAPHVVFNDRLACVHGSCQNRQKRIKSAHTSFRQPSAVARPGCHWHPFARLLILVMVLKPRNSH